MKRSPYSLPHLVGYHGCDRSVGEAVIAGTKKLRPSDRDYDWLGNGVYFWVDSPQRAWNWAKARAKAGWIDDPFVVGALIYPGLCLNLTDFGVVRELRAAHKVLKASRQDKPMPQNIKADEAGMPLVRKLDCAVIQMLHSLRRDADLASYDTVYGVFEEGRPAYQGACFREKTHIQVAVRNLNVIVGCFRVGRGG